MVYWATVVQVWGKDGVISSVAFYTYIISKMTVYQCRVQKMTQEKRQKGHLGGIYLFNKYRVNLCFYFGSKLEWQRKSIVNILLQKHEQKAATKWLLSSSRCALTLTATVNWHCVRLKSSFTSSCVNTENTKLAQCRYKGERIHCI